MIKVDHRVLKIWRRSAAETRSPQGGRTLKLGPGGVMGILAITFAFGFIPMVLVYAIGPISSCHIYPAVTIALLVTRKIGVKDGIAYLATQIIGASLASVVLLGTHLPG